MSITRMFSVFLLVFMAQQALGQDLPENPNDRMVRIVSQLTRTDRKVPMLELFSEAKVTRFEDGQEFTLSENDKRRTGIDRIRYLQFGEKASTTIFPASGKDACVDMAAFISRLGLSPRLQEQAPTPMPHGPGSDGIAWHKIAYGYIDNFGLRASVTNKSMPCLDLLQVITNPG